MFKVMTWNVENLFRPGADAGPTTEPVYRAKLHRLAATINAQAPDALALQEIGDPAALDDLVAQLDGSWNRHLSTHPDQRQIRVAWLTPHAITDPEEIVAFPDHLEPVQIDDGGARLAAMGRGAVAITVQSTAGTAIRLLTTHLKSKLLTFPGGRFQPRDEAERARYAAYALYRRAAEAATLRVWATGRLGEAGHPPLILSGDLNDTTQAATTQLLLGPPGSEIGTQGFGQPDAGDAQRLWNLAPLMPPGRDYSRIDQGRKELIDHILVSAALVKPLDAISVEAIIEQGLPSISQYPHARRDAPGSDHAPVVASFAAA